jgi:hypothetical protein
MSQIAPLSTGVEKPYEYTINDKDETFIPTQPTNQSARTTAKSISKASRTALSAIITAKFSRRGRGGNLRDAR